MYMVTRMVAEQVLLTARSKLLVVEAYTVLLAYIHISDHN